MLGEQGAFEGIEHAIHDGILKNAN